MGPTTSLAHRRDLLAPLAVAGALLALPPTARADRYCGTIPNRGADVAVVVESGTVGCFTARKALRAYGRSRRPCQGAACRRRHYGWTCLNAIGDFPRLASCSLGQRLIAAYSRAD